MSVVSLLCTVYLKRNTLGWSQSEQSTSRRRVVKENLEVGIFLEPVCKINILGTPVTICHNLTFVWSDWTAWLLGKQVICPDLSSNILLLTLSFMFQVDNLLTACVYLWNSRLLLLQEEFDLGERSSEEVHEFCTWRNACHSSPKSRNCVHRRKSRRLVNKVPTQAFLKGKP